MVSLKAFRATGPSFSDLVPYAGLVDRGVLLLKDGSLMAGWYFAGPDSESATNFERNELSRQINAILSRLGSGWMIQVEAIRVPTFSYPGRAQSHFPDPVTRAIDDERRSHFERERGHFESKHALILTYRAPEPKKTALSKYVYQDEGSRKASHADTTLTIFGNAIREIEQYLISGNHFFLAGARLDLRRGLPTVVALLSLFIAQLAFFDLVDDRQFKSQRVVSLTTPFC